MQLPLKITANAYFGSFGSGGGIFPWSDIDCAEETTCCGRQMLRLMLKWFTDKGYEGIVCDSVTGDTPLFIKNKDSNLIDIKSIESLFNDNNKEAYEDGREYDREDKDYDVLCRSGWVNPSYFYRHKTDKDIYRVKDKQTGVCVDVTKDHSLFDENKQEIKPTEIKPDTKLEFYNSESIFNFNTLKISDDILYDNAVALETHKINEVPIEILNSTIECKEKFMDYLSDVNINDDNYPKTVIAGIKYIKNTLALL
jgi:hypothetical protein